MGMNSFGTLDWKIAGGRIVDPVTGRDTVGDLYVVDGRIRLSPPSARRLSCFDASGCVVAPGLIDLHAHLRDPGDPAAENLASGTAAAARGGFTTLVAMPNTRPPLDTAERVGGLAKRACAEGLVRVLVCGCLTLERAGLEAADLAALKAAGAAAFSDDGSTPLDEKLFGQLARMAHSLKLPILDHAEDTRYSAGGVMHAGERCRLLGLPGIVEEAEILAVERDIDVAAETGCRMHVQHVSCAASVERLRVARARGLAVSGEATPHHLAFCDRDFSVNDTAFKINPPLRSERDRKALRRAVSDGVLSVLATDHAPHAAIAKARGFMEAPFGAVGLETALAVTYSLLVIEDGMSLLEWLRRWTTGPAGILGLCPPRLADGQPADLVVFDPDARMLIEPAAFQSRSTNSPFLGRSYHGQVLATLRGGRAVWIDPRSNRLGRLSA